MKFYKKKFQQLREARGLTLDDIAEACGCTKQTVQKWEKHPYLKPKPSKIPQIAAILKCKESDLAQYGPIEKAKDDLNKEDEILKKILFGADVADTIRKIHLANHRRYEYPEDSQEEVEEIKNNLLILFQKLASALKIEFEMINNINSFQLNLIGAFIDSDLEPESLQKVLKIVKNYKG